MSNDRVTDVLDVEDDERRQNRIGTLLEKLNSSSSSVVSPNPLLNIGHERLPGPVEPPTELLARVQAFLPTISASNEALSQMEPEDIDIENIQEDEEQYIEMNLGLGVLEAKPRPKSGSRSASPSAEADSGSDATSSESRSDSESSRASWEEDSESDSSSSSSSSDDDSDSDSQSGSSVGMKPIFSRIIRPLPRRVSQQTKIEV